MKHLTRAQHYKEAMSWHEASINAESSNMAFSDRCRARAQFHATMAANPDLDSLAEQSERPAKIDFGSYEDKELP